MAMDFRPYIWQPEPSLLGKSKPGKLKRSPGRCPMTGIRTSETVFCTCCRLPVGRQYVPHK